jgi:hypothetical protein
LIDLVAEDNAIEDTIYHLTRALDAERIDLDRFLKVNTVLCAAFPLVPLENHDADTSLIANPDIGQGAVSETCADRKDHHGAARPMRWHYKL